MKQNTILAAAALLLLVGCSDDDTPLTQDSNGVADGGAPDQKAAPDSAPPASQLHKLAAWMTGGFNSAKQATSNPNYYDITLVMKRIWKDSKKKGYWLYVEQAQTGSKPYRQRAYFLEQKAGKYVSRVYDIKSSLDKAAAVDCWKTGACLEGKDDTALVEKVGCGVVLTHDASGDTFTGATEGKKCLSTLSGASYATSRVTISKDKMSSWDQGFDSSGNQVWGAVAGPYVFDLIKDLDTDLDK